MSKLEHENWLVVIRHRAGVEMEKVLDREQTGQGPAARKTGELSVVGGGVVGGRRPGAEDRRVCRSPAFEMRGPNGDPRHTQPSDLFLSPDYRATSR